MNTEDCNLVTDNGRMIHFIIERMGSDGKALIPPGTYNGKGIVWTRDSVKLPVVVRVNTRTRRSRIMRRIIRAARRNNLEGAKTLLITRVKRRRKSENWT